MTLMRRPNTHSMQVRRREQRRAVVFATAATIPAAGAVIVAWLGGTLTELFGLLGLLAVAGFGFALDAWQKAKLQRTLGIEVKHRQRIGFYDVTVRLAPEHSMRLTQLTAILTCFEVVDPVDGDPPEMRFSATVHLFVGRVTLGHGERLERTGTFVLPGDLSFRERKPELKSSLTILAEVDGAFLELEEEVKLDLPRTFQVTLSQM